MHSFKANYEKILKVREQIPKENLLPYQGRRPVWSTRRLWPWAPLPNILEPTVKVTFLASFPRTYAPVWGDAITIAYPCDHHFLLGDFHMYF
ncbi:MAG: hypothetical protein V7724_06000 [Sediminicola sp.]